MEDKILLLIQFGVELIRFWLGMTVLFDSKLRRIWAGGTSYVLFAGLLFLGNMQMLDLSLLMWGSMFLISFITTKPPQSKKWSWTLFNVFILMYQEELISMIVSDMAYYQRETITEYRLDLIVSVVSLAVIGFAVFVYKKKPVFLQKQKFAMYIRKSMMPMAIFLAMEIVFVVVALDSVIKVHGNGRQYLIGMILSLLSMLSIGILVIIVFYIKNMDDKLERMLAMEKQMQQLQIQYYETLLEKEEKTRKYRHDINNHLICLNGLMRGEDMEGAKAYIKQMQNRMESIRNHSFHTGIKMLDAILNHYVGHLEEDVVVNVKGRCDREVAVSDIDLCTIFANLIQNAAEAIEASGHRSNRFLSVEINAGDKFVKIEIKNSMDEDRLNVDKKGNLRTSKPDKKNHGLGMLNVREALLKNRGEIQFSTEDNRFSCQVILRIQQNITDNPST